MKSETAAALNSIVRRIVRAGCKEAHAEHFDASEFIGAEDVLETAETLVAALDTDGVVMSLDDRCAIYDEIEAQVTSETWKKCVKESDAANHETFLYFEAGIRVGLEIARQRAAFREGGE